MGASVYKAIGTAANGAVAVSATVPAGMCYRLVSVTAHFNIAPAAAGSLTVTLNAGAGAAYDTLLQTASMVGLTDWVWTPDEEIIGWGGDAFDVAYANADNRTYGVQITVKAV